MFVSAERRLRSLPLILRSKQVQCLIGQPCCFFFDKIYNRGPAKILEQRDSRSIERFICSYSCSSLLDFFERIDDDQVLLVKSRHPTPKFLQQSF